MTDRDGDVSMLRFRRRLEASSAPFGIVLAVSLLLQFSGSAEDIASFGQNSVTQEATQNAKHRLFRRRTRVSIRIGRSTLMQWRSSKANPGFIHPTGDRKVCFRTITSVRLPRPICFLLLAFGQAAKFISIPSITRASDSEKPMAWPPFRIPWPTRLANFVATLTSPTFSSGRSGDSEANRSNLMLICCSLPKKWTSPD